MSFSCSMSEKKVWNHDGNGSPMENHGSFEPFGPPTKGWHQKVLKFVLQDTLAGLSLWFV